MLIEIIEILTFPSQPIEILRLRCYFSICTSLDGGNSSEMRTQIKKTVLQAVTDRVSLINLQIVECGGYF